LHSTLKSKSHIDTTTTILSTSQISSILNNNNLSPLIIYETPSKSNIGSIAIVREDKELTKIADEILNPEILKILEKHVDNIILCIIDLYNEVGSGTQMAQEVVTGVVTSMLGFGVSVAEKNVVVMNILICSNDGKLIVGTNKELKFENESSYGIEITRSNFSSKICDAILF
jgi:hypothetical protein